MIKPESLCYAAVSLGIPQFEIYEVKMSTNTNTRLR